MKYQDQLEAARAKYEGHPEGKGMAYLANLELGNWLTEAFNWDWYSTHTFADENTSKGQADRSWQRWLNSLILQCKAYALDRPHYVRVTEFQELRASRTIHYHALVGNVGDIRRLLFKDLWEFDGFARVEKYDPGKGAGFYLGKYLTKAGSDIRFSHNLKRRVCPGVNQGGLTNSGA